jgi:hypothetical protein
LNEKPLFGAPVVALPNSVSYLTYDEIIARKFQPKQRKKDQWTSAEVATLLEAVNGISSGDLVPIVCEKYSTFMFRWKMLLISFYTIYFKIPKHLNRLNGWLNSKLERRKKDLYKINHRFLL